MNLSDHLEPIHKSISEFKQLSKQPQQHDEGDLWGLFSCLDDLSFVVWFKCLVVYGTVIFGVVLLIVIHIPWILSCVQQIINSSLNKVMAFQEQTVLTVEYVGDKKNLTE